MSDEKLRQGTPAWLEMVGATMTGPARRLALPADLTVSLLERYTDGAEIGDGLVQGIRFNIVHGQASFRIGAGRDESADIVIEVTAAAARELNSLLADDPRYAETRDLYLRTGEMCVHGDIAPLGKWLDAAHDPIVERTV